MRHTRARLEKATVLREIVVVLVLASPSASYAAWDATALTFGRDSHYIHRHDRGEPRTFGLSLS